MIIRLFIILCLLYLSSCDCVQNVKGVVVDTNTGSPLEGVRIHNRNKSHHSTETDKNGYFELSSISGGLNCPPMNIVIDKTGYRIIEESIEAGGEERINLEPLSTNAALDQATALKNIRSIFEDYKHDEESIDSEENKDLMTRSLTSLRVVSDEEAMELLIDVWQYYDPTDFLCRPLVFEILLRDKRTSIAAVEKRIRNKKPWESENVEFKDLMKQLENE